MSQPLSLQITALHKVVGAHEAHEYLWIKIIAPKELSGPRPRLSTVLVLDTSGSMNGEPLRQVIRSAVRLSEILSSDDSLGVVAFNNSALQISPLRRLDAEARRSLHREVEGLRANGGTNLSAGLMVGALMFAPAAPDERQLLLVMSDGQPNVGSATKEALSKEAELIKDKGHAISSLGYGMSHNEDILFALAEAGGGRYSFVSDPALAGASFAKALGAQRDIVAQQVSLVLSPAEHVEISRIFDDPKTSFSAEGIRLPLPDLLVEDDLNVLIELKTSYPTHGLRPLLRASLQWRQVGAAEVLTAQQEVSVEVGARSEGRQREAHAQVAIGLAAELRERAQKIAESRDFAAARKVFEEAKRLLEEVTEFSDHPMVSDAWETVIDDIAAMDKISSEAEYNDYRKMSKDGNDFATNSTKIRQGSMQIKPSSVGMLELLQGGVVPVLRLRVTEKGGAPRELEFQKPELSIGRVQGNDIVLGNGSASKRHTRLAVEPGGVTVIDLKSTNGTYLNGARLAAPARLSVGDKLQIGDFELELL